MPAHREREALQKEHDRSPYIVVDYTLENDPAKLRVKADKMIKFITGKRLRNKSTSLNIYFIFHR